MPKLGKRKAHLRRLSVLKVKKQDTSTEGPTDEPVLASESNGDQLLPTTLQQQANEEGS